MNKRKEFFTGFVSLNLIACLLGNFVDAYDMFLFSAIRVTSLKDLGLTGQAVLDQGIFLLNTQLIGMFLGGIIAGIVGDKRGRLSVLFGSIVVYSFANLANAFVHTVPQYAACRFFAGLGLAGELGACITLLLEILPAHLRGYGTMLLLAFGHVAAVLASTLANVISWRFNFFLGGVLGLFVLLLRVSTRESELFVNLTRQEVTRGDFFSMFSTWKKVRKYVACFLTSTSPWYCFGVLVVFAPEIAPHLGLRATLEPEKYMPYYFIALILGDLTSGYLSQKMRTRKWIIVCFILGQIAASLAFFLYRPMTVQVLYVLISLFGFFSAFTVLSFTLAAEQFGTQIRATAATTTPNFVRASAVLFTSVFGVLKISLGVVQAAAIIGVTGLLAALVSSLSLKDTFGRNLNFLEE